MYNQVPETITIDGKDVAMSDLSPKSRTLAVIYTKWQNELIDARLEVDKLTISIKEAERQLSESVSTDLATPEETPAETPAEVTAG